MRRSCLTALSLAPCLALVALAPGCYESFTRPLDVIIRDSGPLPDGGVGVEPSPSDGGRPYDSAVTTDTGVLPVCTGEVVGAYEGPGCAPETRRCLEACDESGCTDACYAADPECMRCLNETLVSCGNQLGCQAVWDVFACCTTFSCPELGDGLDRFICAASGACEPELVAYAECLSGEIIATCEPRLVACLH